RDFHVTGVQTCALPIYNKRYAVLFSYDVSDYKSWAKGLKACGYATNPKYAQRIIDLIERYDLNRYSLLAVKEYFDVGDDEALSRSEERRVGKECRVRCA